MAASSVVSNARPVTARRLTTAELLFRSAQDMGLSPVWVTADGLFAVTVDGHEQYVNFARSALNSHTSASLAKDKYLTRRILERHQLPNIPFAAVLTHAEAVAFLKTHGKIIAKPTRGSGSRGIHIVTEVRQLEELSIAQYILEKYIVGKEMRYLVLNGEVIGAHHNDYGTSVKAGRAHQSTSYHRADWDPVLVASSTNIARILGLKFAAVDYLIDASGQAHTLEVNTAPDLQWFHAPTAGPPHDVARQFLEAIFNPVQIPKERKAT